MKATNSSRGNDRGTSKTVAVRYWSRSSRPDSNASATCSCRRSKSSGSSAKRTAAATRASRSQPLDRSTPPTSQKSAETSAIEGLSEASQPARNVRPEVDPEHPAVLLPERLIVAQRLGPDELAEREARFGDLEVVPGGVHDLEEAPTVGAPLVQLTGGMQEAGAVPEGRGDPLPCEDRSAQELERAPGGRTGGEVGLDPDVISRATRVGPLLHGAVE